MRCFCCLCRYETVKLLSCRPASTAAGAIELNEEINIGVRRLLPLTRRHIIAIMTSDGSNWVVPQRGLELFRNRLTASRTRVYEIAAPDVIILLAGPPCQQLLSSFSCYITPLQHLFIPSPLDLKSHISQPIPCKHPRYYNTSSILISPSRRPKQYS